MVRTFIVAALFACSITHVAKAEPDPIKDWHPPKEGVIRDSRTAITIARAIWTSMHPELKIGSEKDWQAGSVATLKNGIWEVGPRMEPTAIGGGLWVLLSQQDAHVVAIYLTQ